MNWTIFALSLIPALLWIAYFYYQDKYEKESLALLAWVFILGCLSVIPAIIIEGAAEYWINFHMPFGPIRILIIMLVVGFSEEFCKFVALKNGAYQNPEFNEPMDGIVYSVTVAMGFAFIENIAYMLWFKSPSGMLGIYSLGIFRAIFSMFGHASFAVVLGSYMGKAKFNPKNEKILLWKGYIYASLLHALYDFTLIINRIELSLFPLLVAFILVWRDINRVHMDAAEENSPFKPDNIQTKPKTWKWGTINIISVILILGSIVMGLFLFHTPVNFKNSEIGYKISHPSYWSKKINKNYTILELRGPIYKGTFPSVWVEARNWQGNLDLNLGVKSIISEISRRKDNLKKLSVETINFNKKKGMLVKASWSKKENNKNVDITSYFALTYCNGKLIILRSELKEDKFKNINNQVKNIIKSFEEINK